MNNKKISLDLLKYIVGICLGLILPSVMLVMIIKSEEEVICKDPKKISKKDFDINLSIVIGFYGYFIAWVFIKIGE